MAAIYGFKANDPKDAVAINNLEIQASQSKEQRYQTLAQYRINDLELKPATISFGRPREWMLTMNTTMLGFNQPNKQAIFFRHDDSPVGDGYLTYRLSVDEFTQMLKGGLYINAKDYLNRIKAELHQKEFFRQTTCRLTKITLEDQRFVVATGDLTQKTPKVHEYYIGEDLQSYVAFDEQHHIENNLQQVLDHEIDLIASDPVLRDMKTKDIQAEAQAQADRLNEVTITSEVDLGLDSLEPAQVSEAIEQATPNSMSVLQQLQSLQAAQSQASQESVQSASVSEATISDESNASSATENQSSATRTKRSVAISDEMDLGLSEEASSNSEFSTPASNSDETNSSTARTKRSVALSDEAALDAENSAESTSTAPSQPEEKPETESKPTPESEEPVDDDEEEMVDDDEAEGDDEAVEDEDDGNVDFTDSMNELNEAAQPTTRRKRRQHVYVDDFANALQSSNQAQQAKLNRQRVARSQEAKMDQEGPNL